MNRPHQRRPEIIATGDIYVKGGGNLRAGGWTWYQAAIRMAGAA